MFDEELILIKIEREIVPPGVTKDKETRTTVLCGRKSAHSSDFNAGRMAGQKLSYVFTVHTYEYNREQEVEYRCKRYKVFRTFEIDFETLELHCEERAGVS